MASYRNSGLMMGDEKNAVASTPNCFEKGYQKHKEYNQGDWKEIACDVGDLFGGACTVAGVLRAAMNCL